MLDRCYVKFSVERRPVGNEVDTAAFKLAAISTRTTHSFGQCCWNGHSFKVVPQADDVLTRPTR